MLVDINENGDTGVQGGLGQVNARGRRGGEMGKQAAQEKGWRTTEFSVG